jgi:hypothetical protein
MIIVWRTRPEGVRVHEVEQRKALLGLLSILCGGRNGEAVNHGVSSERSTSQGNSLTVVAGRPQFGRDVAYSDG